MTCAGMKFRGVERTLGVDGMNEAQLVSAGMSHEEIVTTARALVEGEPNMIANMANASSLVFHGLGDVNWVGFYLWDGKELVLGPFQGRPACLRIALGQGVCGTAAAERRTVLVDDVHEFPGHIACDSNSQSEVVAPVIGGDGKLIGVFDLDSPTKGRFGAEEQKLVEDVVALLLPAQN